MQQVQRQSRVPKPVNVDGMLAPRTSLILELYCQVCTICQGISHLIHQIWLRRLQYHLRWNLSNCPVYFQSSLDHQWINPWPCQKHILCSPTCKDCSWPEGGGNALRLSISRCLAQVECTIYRLMKPFSFRILYINLKPPQNVNSFWVFSPKEIQPWKPLS